MKSPIKMMVQKVFLGETNWPLIFRYDWAMTQSWFLAPQLNYTPLPRDVKGKTAKVTITQLDFKFGMNTSSGFDWSIGPSILRETIKGKGGTVVMSNGTGTSTFAQPGREVTIQKVLLNVGGGFTTGKYHWGADLYFVSPFSSDERTQNLMFSVTYNLSGSGGSSGGGGGMFDWSR